MVSPLLELPDRLRARGVEVVEVAGWRDRRAVRRDGSSPFAPVGVLVHDTGSGRTFAGNPAPSLGTVVAGRAGLPGPLYQVLIGYDGAARMVAAGRANHAGRGVLEGIGRDNGNAELVGVALENAGAKVREPIRSAQLVTLAHTLDVAAQLVGATLAGHKDYSSEGKPDPWPLSRDDLHRLRDQAPTPKGDPPMRPEIVRRSDGAICRVFPSTGLAVVLDDPGDADYCVHHLGDLDRLHLPPGEADAYLAAFGAVPSAGLKG